jgi:hypothetical protein
MRREHVREEEANGGKKKGLPGLAAVRRRGASRRNDPAARGFCRGEEREPTQPPATAAAVLLFSGPFSEKHSHLDP